MLIRAAAAETLDDLHAEPLFVSLSAKLRRATYDYIMIPFTDTMHTDLPEDNFVRRSAGMLQCQWSLLIIDVQRKQISLINGQTIPHHQHDGRWVARISNRSVTDAAFWLVLSISEAFGAVLSYSKRTLFVPDENEDNLFNDDGDDQQDPAHDFDAASGPLICLILEYLLATEGDADPAQHFLRNGLHRHFLDLDKKADWAEFLGFHSRDIRLGVAELIKRRHEEYAGPDSLLRLSVELLRIFGNAGGKTVEDLFTNWLEQGNNKELLHTDHGIGDDASSDDGVTSSTDDDDDDENNAGGPPESEGPGRKKRRTRRV
ncbi:hypothetical protein N0V86_008536 [Didymella sp. IMI 355093]|nr:hypothetical protein N0V86_008536 [Didymella sp. IMI 355093]